MQQDFKEAANRNDINLYLRSSRCVELTVSAMRLPPWRLEVMSQVLRTQLTHKQTRSFSNAQGRESLRRRKRREDVADGQGETG